MGSKLCNMHLKGQPHSAYMSLLLSKQVPGKYRISVHSICGAPGGHVTFPLAAALLSILLFGLQPVVSDSDELVHTEWEVWKSQHGINYDENVRCATRLESYFGNS